MDRRSYGVLLLLAITMFITVSTVLATTNEMRLQVEEILSNSTLHGKETREDLIALGPDAAPILAEKLWTYKFKGILFDVLIEFRDPKTTPLLLQYLNEKGDDMVIDVLKEIGDQRAEVPLMNIVRSQETSVETRLLAAAAVARLGTPAAKQESEHFIMDIYECSRAPDCRFPSPFDNGMTVQDALDTAIPEVDTPEAFEIALDLLQDKGRPHIQKRTIAIFTTRQNPKMLEALKVFCLDSTQNDVIRFYGIKRLRNTGKVPEATINTYLDQLFQETIDNKVHTEIERLKQQMIKDTPTH